MGLDQYAFAVKDDSEKIEIMYWRKHADLEGYMSDLWESRGGIGEFNCKDLRLFEDDLLTLKRRHKNFNRAQGFFWGESSPEKVKQTEEFINAALKYVKDGYKIVYTSWW